MRKIKLIIENVRDIINDSDPVGLVDGGAPDDEYDNEVMSIVSVLQCNNKKEVTRHSIKKILNKSFGPDVVLDGKKIDQMTDKLMELKKRLKF